MKLLQSMVCFEKVFSPNLVLWWYLQLNHFLPNCNALFIDLHLNDWREFLLKLHIALWTILNRVKSPLSFILQNITFSSPSLSHAFFVLTSNFTTTRTNILSLALSMADELFVKIVYPNRRHKQLRDFAFLSSRYAQLWSLCFHRFFLFIF